MAATHQFYIRDLLSVVIGVSLSVDEKRIKDVITHFAGKPDYAMRDQAARAIMASVREIGTDIPDASRCKAGEKQRIYIDWASQRINAYLANHGDEVVTIQ